MKNLPYILLLTLFSHTLLWGQDTIKFEQIEFNDTIWTEQLSIKNDWSSKDKNLLIVNSGDTSIFFYKKGNSYWLRSSIEYYCSHINCFEIDSDSTENYLFLYDYFTHGANGSLSNEKYVSFINLKTFKYYDPITVYSRHEGWDWKDTNAQVQVSFCHVSIKFEANKIFIESIVSDEDLVSESGQSDIYIDDEICAPTGEYHYINGNFVKVKTYINQHTFTNTAYDLGEKTYLTPECAFYFECDCCSEHLLFTSDSTFVVVAPCTQDVSVSQGKYEVIDNALHLHFSGIWQERYMVSDEPNKPAEYAYRTNTIPPHTAIFAPEICKNTTLFTEQNNPNHKLLRSQQSLEEYLEYLKEVGLKE